jgi:hypothetical protein
MSMALLLSRVRQQAFAEITLSKLALGVNISSGCPSVIAGTTWKSFTNGETNPPALLISALNAPSGSG